ncbi:hypothetical protein M378DRAFT_165042 [Amanita muscaria Koide BX008]|uniref:Uncharacterized protein n=1 Tax=Amanita muscaria (strain Koide BX008) TaxID=946122 RepID=A0A0C2WMZ6_AMAMK|nr:hypothetical protein M378DRAFT_165042 [Amanita muscaria Koide BX008]
MKLDLEQNGYLANAGISVFCEEIMECSTCVRGTGRARHTDHYRSPLTSRKLPLEVEGIQESWQKISR